MIVGLGMDVVDVGRMRRILAGPPARVERFLVRVFTDRERAACDAVKDRATPYAARFAAKEAASKALGAPRGIAWHDVEVVRAPSGAPALVLAGVAAREAERLGVSRVHVTLTHDAGIAAATAVLEAP